MITKWLPANADDVQIGSEKCCRVLQNGAQAVQAANGSATCELSRSSSGVSSSNGSLGGLCTPSSCYTAIVATTSSMLGDTSAADALVVPGVNNRGMFDRTNSGNILLCGSVEELGAAGSVDPTGDFGAAATADQGYWEAACYVQAGRPSSAYGRAKLGCCGVLWAAGGDDDDGFDDDFINDYGIDQDVGGIAIKSAGRSHAAAAGTDFRIPVGKLPTITCQQPSDVSTAAAATPAAATPKTAVAGLDMARFDRSPWEEGDDDLGALMAGASSSRFPVHRSVSEPTQRSPCKLVLRQSSALSAALASSMHRN